MGLVFWTTCQPDVNGALRFMVFTSYKGPTKIYDQKAPGSFHRKTGAKNAETGTHIRKREQIRKSLFPTVWNFCVAALTMGSTLWVGFCKSFCKRFSVPNWNLEWHDLTSWQSKNCWLDASTQGPGNSGQFIHSAFLCELKEIQYISMFCSIMFIICRYPVYIKIRYVPNISQPWKQA